MNHAAVAEILERVAKKNNIEPDRLKELLEDPSQVAVADEKAPQVYNPETAVGFAQAEPGRLRRSNLADLPVDSQHSDGITESRTYQAGDGTRITERRMSMERLQSYIPPAEPDFPPLGLPYTGKVTAQVLLDAGKASTLREARSMLRKSTKGVLVLPQIAAYPVAVAAYKREHPDYDEHYGMVQRPTPHLYTSGGIRESIFGDNPEADEVLSRHDEPVNSVASVNG